jgi:hypothetical protein
MGDGPARGKPSTARRSVAPAAARPALPVFLDLGRKRLFGQLVANPATAALAARGHVQPIAAFDGEYVH